MRRLIFIQITYPDRPKRLSWLAIAALITASCGLLAAHIWLEPDTAQRLEAQRRWAARPFANYRVEVQAEYIGIHCVQEIESAGERLRRIVQNDCRAAWFPHMTVARLFEISESLEHPAPCYTASQACSCYRVGAGAIAYDPQLGYPRSIAYRRVVYPNLLHIGYWRLVWQTGRLPACGPISPVARITVTALQPRV